VTRRIGILLGALLAGCAGDVQPAQGALGDVEETLGDAPRLVAGGEEELLDRRADGAAIFGRMEPAVEDADPERVLVLRASVPGLDGLRVLDARFVDGGVVVIGADHVLRLLAAGDVRTLDENVYGPLSVAGDRVAYTRGEMPVLELARADLSSGEVAALTTDMAPVWSPALSADGREVIFVSGASGSPRLCRLGANGVVVLPEVERFPSSPRAPRWEGDELRFEDEEGALHVLDVRAGALSP
jgi:hypothetical protein